MRKEAAVRIDQGFDKLEAKSQKNENRKEKYEYFSLQGPNGDRPVRSIPLLAGWFSLSMGRCVVRM